MWSCGVLFLLVGYSYAFYGGNNLLNDESFGVDTRSTFNRGSLHNILLPTWYKKRSVDLAPELGEAKPMWFKRSTPVVTGDEKMRSSDLLPTWYKRASGGPSAQREAVFTSYDSAMMPRWFRRKRFVNPGMWPTWEHYWLHPDAASARRKQLVIVL